MNHMRTIREFVDNENSEGYKLRRPQLASPTFLKCFGVKDGLSIEMLYSFCICVVFEINRKYANTC